MAAAGLPRQGRARPRDRRAQPPQRPRRRHDAPGRLLLRIAPDAISRLGAGPQRGSTIISATNGKTTTAGMLAAALRAAGRDPVHNRAGSNMSWGVATALLEQRGSEGLFEVDEAWLPRIAAELDPGLIVLGNLFRDQLDRYGELETLADEWAAMVDERSGPHRLRAQRRRPADRRPRARPRAPPPARGHLLRDRGPGAGAARAPARPRRQALPPLRPPVRATRARSSATSATTAAPTAAPTARPPTSRRPRSSSTGCAARARACGPPRARPSSSSPSPASTTSTTRSPRSAARCDSGSRLERRARCARLGRGRLRAGGDDRGRGEAGLDPADQEPRRGERGPANPAARGRCRRRASAPRPLDRAQRPDRRRARRLLDLGRGLRAARRGGAQRRLRGTRAPEMALRLKYAGLDPAATHGRALDRALARPRGRPPPTGALFALPTYTALIELRRLLAARGLAREFWR